MAGICCGARYIVRVGAHCEAIMWWMLTTSTTIAALVVNVQASEPRNGMLSDKAIKVNSAQQTLRLVHAEMIQKDIECTPQQSARLSHVEDVLRTSFQEAFVKSRSLPPGDADRQMAANVVEADDRAQKEIEGILLPSQLKRLEEIGFQLVGATIFESPDIADHLALSSNQRGLVARILENKGQELDAAIQAARMDVPQARTDEWRTRRRQWLEKEQDIEMRAYRDIITALTHNQREQVEVLKGKEIDIGALRRQLDVYDTSK